MFEGLFAPSSLFAADIDHDFCFGQNSQSGAAIAACSRLIASEPDSGSNLIDVYNRRGYLYAKAGEADHASADLSEAIRLASEKRWGGLWTFVAANWAIILGIIGAGVGWFLTYRGWAITRQNNSALEKERYQNTIDLEKRKAELVFVSDQIRLLYGPLMSLCETRTAAFDVLMDKHARGRKVFFDGQNRTPEDLHWWRLWRTEILMPLITRMEETILQNAHLILAENLPSKKMPKCFVDLLQHVGAYKAVIKNWDDIIASDKEAGTQKIDELSERDYTSVMNFPRDFSNEVEKAFLQLKKRQAELIERTQTSTQVTVLTV